MFNFIGKYFLYGNVHTVGDYIGFGLYALMIFMILFLATISFIEEKLLFPVIAATLIFLFGLMIIWLNVSDSTSWSLYIKSVLNTKL